MQDSQQENHRNNSHYEDHREPPHGVRNKAHKDRPILDTVCLHYTLFQSAVQPRLDQPTPISNLMFPRNLGTTTGMAKVSGQKRVSRVSYSSDADETLDALPS